MKSWIVNPRMVWWLAWSRVKAWAGMRRTPIVTFRLWGVGDGGVAARCEFRTARVRETHLSREAVEQMLAFLIAYEPRLGVDVQRIYRQSRAGKSFRYGLIE